MQLVEKQHDVTKLPTRYVIAHCISCDCAMGAGVVIPIRQKFPFLKMYCLEYVRLHPDALGTAYRHKNAAVGVVYNLFSKQYVYHKAGFGVSYNEYLLNLEKCLIDMKNQMIEYGETTLGIPKIGCGLDGCKWEDVKNTIENVFKDTDINILVCYL